MLAVVNWWMNIIGNHGYYEKNATFKLIQFTAEATAIATHSFLFINELNNECERNYWACVCVCVCVVIQICVSSCVVECRNHPFLMPLRQSSKMLNKRKKGERNRNAWQEKCRTERFLRIVSYKRTFYSFANKTAAKKYKEKNKITKCEANELFSQV